MKSLQDYYLKPGFIFASSEGMLIKTVLGSCVAVCLWDQRRGFGGMNHHIYPYRKSKPPDARYGDAAVPYLIRIMRKLGSAREDLVAHIIGGASNPLIKSDIGAENAAVAEKILFQYGIEIVNRGIGGSIGKKVVFNTATGELLVYNCMQLRESDWYEQD